MNATGRRKEKIMRYTFEAKGFSVEVDSFTLDEKRRKENENRK